MALLSFQTHRRDRPCIKPFKRNRLTRDLTIAIFALVNAAQRGVNFRHELTLAVPRAQFQRAISFFAGAICNIWDIARAVLKPFDRFLAVAHQIIFPIQQLSSKIFHLTLIHKWLVFGRSIAIRNKTLLLHYYPLAWIRV